MSEWKDEDGLILRGVRPANAAYLNALEAEVERLKAKAALADEVATRIRKATEDDWLLTALEDWLDSYDALEEKKA